MEDDKKQHRFYSGLINLFCFIGLLFLLNFPLSFIIAPVIAFAVGVGKEVRDKTTGTGTPDKKDIAANVEGIAIAQLLIILGASVYFFFFKP